MGIEDDFRELHDTITRWYYEEKRISKAVFDKLHTACWFYLEAAQIKLGLIPDRYDFDVAPDSRKMRSVELKESIAALGDVNIYYDNLGLTSPVKILKQYKVDII